MDPTALNDTAIRVLGPAPLIPGGPLANSAAMHAALGAAWLDAVMIWLAYWPIWSIVSLGASAATSAVRWGPAILRPLPEWEGHVIARWLLQWQYALAGLALGYGLGHQVLAPALSVSIEPPELRYGEVLLGTGAFCILAYRIVAFVVPAVCDTALSVLGGTMRHLPGVYRRIRPYLPGLGLLLALGLANIALAAPGADPNGFTASQCSFGTNTAGFLQRWAGGLSVLLLAAGFVVGILSVRGGSGSGGGEVAAGGVSAMMGISILLAALGAVTGIAAIINQAAGLPPCP